MRGAPAEPIAAAPESVLIILDASYSMGEQLASGETKMIAAKRVINQLLAQVPPTTQLGLRVYGQSHNPFMPCNSTALLVPLGLNNRAAISNALLKIQPTGETPISLSIRTAARQDFIGVAGKKSILLVSDGIETCDADPCQVSVELMRQGLDVRINTIGLGLQDESAIKQLRCVALATMGRYTGANTSAQLARSMGKHLNAKTQVQAQIMMPPR